MFISTLILALLFGVVLGGPASPAASVAQPAPLEALVIDGEPVDGLAVEPVSSEARYAAVSGTLYRADGSGGWEASGTSPNLATMVVDSRNPDVIWAGTALDCYRGGGVALSLMRSDDGGAAWTQVGTGGLVPLASWDPGGIVVAHDCSGLQVSDDGGATWAMPEDLPLGSQVTAFAVVSSPESAAGLGILVGVTGEGGTSQLYQVGLSDPARMEVAGPLATYYAIGSLGFDNSGAILLGAPQGVLRSEDRGESWTLLRDGLESTTLEQDPVEFFPTDLEPGSFGLPAMVTSGEEVFVAGVDGIYRLDHADGSWREVVAIDVRVRAMAVEPGTGALLVSTDDGEVLRVEVGSAGM